MAENQQPMREALEIAKRDEARKDAREKRAIEDGKKMEQERQAAEKERREFRKSGDEFRRKSLENVSPSTCPPFFARHPFEGRVSTNGDVVRVLRFRSICPRTLGAGKVGLR